MLNYRGVECSHCHKTFADGDDIVVCPVCGTPHHRSCYFQLGRCANDSKHSGGFQWVSPSAAEPAADADGIVCPKCGKVNRPDNTFCNYCGDPITAQRKEVFEASDYGLPEFDDNDEIDGIKVSVWKTYIGRSWWYYLYQFKTQDRLSRRITFNWSALIFPSLFFLYRKAWRASTLAFACAAMFGLPTMVAGIMTKSSLFLGLSYPVWSNISAICSLASSAACIFFGLFGNWIVRKASEKRIKELMSASGDNLDFQQKLESNAGPSRKALLIAAIVILALSFASAAAVFFIK